MNEMVERVAGAIARNRWQQLPPAAQQHSTPNPGISDFQAARAAIEAMREPTESMETAAMDAALDNGGWDIAVYQARIDAALKE